MRLTPLFALAAAGALCADASAQCQSASTAFLAGCGTVTDSEDFSGFTMDTFFDVPGGLAIGTNMNIEALNPIGFRNFVETPPFQFGDNNGTNHASCFTNQDEPVEIRVDLGGASGGYGMTVSGATSGEVMEMAVMNGGGQVAVCAVASNSNMQFVGYNGACDMILMRSMNLNPGGGGEGFGADDFIVCDGGMNPIGMTTTDCPALPNSLGQVPNVTLFGLGTAGSVVMGTIANGPPTEFGYFISGVNAGIIPAGCGLVCVGGPQFRYNSAGLGHIYQFDAAGDAGPIDLATDGSFAPVPAVVVGETRRFQGWYRDAGCAMAGQQYNFTDVVAVTFN